MQSVWQFYSACLHGDSSLDSIKMMRFFTSARCIVFSRGMPCWWTSGIMCSYLHWLLIRSTGWSVWFIIPTKELYWSFEWHIWYFRHWCLCGVSADWSDSVGSVSFRHYSILWQRRIILTACRIIHWHLALCCWCWWHWRAVRSCLCPCVFCAECLPQELCWQIRM